MEVNSTGAPYHPQTNELAERAVKTFKASFKKFNNNLSIQAKISRIFVLL